MITLHFVQEITRIIFQHVANKFIYGKWIEKKKFENFEKNKKNEPEN